jgi:hypothetical protein
MIIPFTLKDWYAGGKPVTRSGQEIKQLTFFEGVRDEYVYYGILDNHVTKWKSDCKKIYQLDLMLEVDSPPIH